MEEEDEEEPEGSGFAKELLLTGWGRGKWGECREWDLAPRMSQGPKDGGWEERRDREDDDKRRTFGVGPMN